jgi:hypothetical protein
MIFTQGGTGCLQPVSRSDKRNGQRLPNTATGFSALSSVAHAFTMGTPIRAPGTVERQPHLLKFWCSQ